MLGHMEGNPPALNSLLSNDFNTIIQSIDVAMASNISETKFLQLFDEGLRQGFQMLLYNLEYDRFKLHRKRIRTSKRLLTTSRFCHPVFHGRIKLRKSGKTKVNGNHYGIFADFRGKWFGLWKEHRINQCWLAPRYIRAFFEHNGHTTLLKSFQTVAIGDGIGWNYTIEYKKKLYLLGYTVHFNGEGKIYLKRPHLGMAQKQNALLWITKNNYYLEYICKSEKCSALPLHYCISGSYFRKSDDVSPVEIFQAVYLSDKSTTRVPFQIQKITKH